MSAERWKTIEPLIDAALALTPGQRRIFLEQACDGDDALLAEIETMIAECEEPSTLLEPPAYTQFTSLQEPDDFPHLHDALAERYALQRELGRGGAAVVFLARDLKHDRDVAIKVLKPDSSHALGPERFLREIGIVGRLSHPHILPMFDSGDAAGSPYYVMPFVEGRSLRNRLQAEPQLPIEECIRVSRELLSALDFAHRQGVIHRDIKPENILLHDGRALVADFGIARARSQAGDQELTAAHLSMGTPAYMSPEQATNAQHVDGRSDIYATGCVLFEMLTGQPPYSGPTTVSVIAQHIAAPVPSARALRATVSPALDATIRCALAKSPVDRYATAAKMADALLEAVSETPGGTPAAHDFASIAVLPFLNLSADPENEYFSEGVTEEILNALTTIPALRVASRRSSFAFKGQNISATEIAARLNVRTILEGSLRRSGDRIRITAQLINALDGYTLWSERYDRELQDVFAIQEDIARTIVDTLRVRLTRAEAGSLGRRPTDNLEAYELYLRGRHCWFHRGMLKKSMSYFQKALEKDEDYALAYHGLADGYCTLGLYGFAPPGEVMARAGWAVERAVALAPDSAEVRTSQGFLQLLGWDWAAAEQTLRSAIQLNPNYALSYSFYAWLLTTVGRAGEAEDAAKRGQELDPLSPVTNGIAALVAYHAGKYEQAIHECERALEIEPSSFLGLLAITLSHTANGSHDDAIHYAEEGVRLSPDAHFLRGLLGAVYGLAGRKRDAEEVLLEFDRRAATTYIAPVLRSWVHAAIGAHDVAFPFLEEAFTERSCLLGFGVRFPIYDALRTDPRFADLLRRMNLR